MNFLPRAGAVTTLTVLAAVALVGCGSDDATDAADCAFPTADQPAARQVEKPATGNDLPSAERATLTLGQGTVEMILTPERTPCTVGSFVSLAEQGWFDGTRCHRLTTAGIHVLQCGDPTGTGTGSPGYTIPDEVDGSETYPAGTVAMAKTREPDSGGSQFFLVYEDSELPPDYTVFGAVDDGLAVLRRIAEKGVEGGAPDGPPAEAVTIDSVTVG